MKIKILSIILASMILLAGCSSDSEINEEPSVVDNDEEVAEEVVKAFEEEATKQLAPDFTLMNLNGEEVSLSDYKGKLVLVNFWATWCVYCDLEMPDLQRLADENDDLVVLAVDAMEEKSVVEEYINENGYDFQVLLDTDGGVSSSYMVSGYPASYFIDPEGVLLGYYPGMMTYDQMNEILDSIR